MPHSHAEFYDHTFGFISPAAVAEKTICIIGLGSIGSFTAYALAKLGFQTMYLFDPDTIKPHNVGCQMFNPSDIGLQKVDVVSQMIGHMVPDRLANNRRFDICVADYYVIAVDSLTARREIFDRLPRNQSWLIDARMGGEYLNIQTLRLDGDLTAYQRTLHAEPDPQPCSQGSIVYNNMVIGGLITNQVKRLILGQPISPQITFDLDSLAIMARVPV